MKALSTKTIRRGTSILLCLVMLLSTSVFALALDNPEFRQESFVSEGPIRGDNPPTASTTLPYTGSGSALKNFVFSNYRFQPIGGMIYVTLNGTVSSGTCKITVELYRSSDDALMASRDCGTASSWYNYTPAPFTGLNNSTYYYYKIVKTASSPSSNTISYSLRCW